MNISEGGAISGTPWETGSFTPVFSLTSASGIPVSQELGLTINPPDPMAIESQELPSTSIGESYQVQLKASGGLPPYRWSSSESDQFKVSQGGLLTGTPTRAGAVRINVFAVDSYQQRQIKTISIKVGSPPKPETPEASGPSILTTALPGGKTR